MINFDNKVEIEPSSKPTKDLRKLQRVSIVNQTVDKEESNYGDYDYSHIVNSKFTFHRKSSTNSFSRMTNSFTQSSS